MRPEIVQARRHRTVRDAARGWRKSGIIDDTALAAIAARYPDDRVSRSRIWRALVFLFVWVIASAAMGMAFALFRPSERGGAVMAILFGMALAVATEIEQGPGRLDGTGAEAATSFLAVTSIVAGAAVLFDPGSPAIRLAGVMLLSALLWGAAAWRWGFAAYGVFSSVSLFVAAAAFAPGVRVVWVVIAAAALMLSVAARRRKLAPPHRTAWAGVAGTALAALYAAGNLASYDRRWIEALRPGSSPAPATTPGARFLAIGATAAYPAVLVVLGMIRRRRLLVDLGLVFGGLSLATLRVYVHLGPLWAILCAAGAALAVAAGVAERVFARERGGWTAEPLDGDEERASAVNAIAAAVALSPDSRPPAAAAEFTPGGGRYGGGGASGEF